MNLAQAKIALVHDYLVQDGGAERVLGALQEMFPEAPTYTLIHRENHAQVEGHKVISSSLQRWPGSQKFFRCYMPMMPQAVEQFDLTGFNLVISSSSSFAKGVIVPDDAVHVCYCHTPTRFLWQERFGYINEPTLPRILRTVLPRFFHNLRAWDLMAAGRPDHMVTNSLTSQSRIKRFYRRDTSIIHPPVDVERIAFSDDPRSYWLAGGRLVSYKRFDLLIQTFNRLRLPLKIFGIGPEWHLLKRMAGPTVELLGYIPEEQKSELYGRAIAFILPQIEDFGITVVEAMAAGTPVIALNKGGGAETVVPGVTGIHMEEQSVDSLSEAVRRFNTTSFDPRAIRSFAETFSVKRFQDEMRSFLETIPQP